MWPFKEIPAEKPVVPETVTLHLCNGATETVTGDKLRYDSDWLVIYNAGSLVVMAPVRSIVMVSTEELK